MLTPQTQKDKCSYFGDTTLGFSTFHGRTNHTKTSASARWHDKPRTYYAAEPGESHHPAKRSRGGVGEGTDQRRSKNAAPVLDRANERRNSPGTLRKIRQGTGKRVRNDETRHTCEQEQRHDQSRETSPTGPRINCEHKRRQCCN